MFLCARWSARECAWRSLLWHAEIICNIWLLQLPNLPYSYATNLSFIKTGGVNERKINRSVRRKKKGGKGSIKIWRFSQTTCWVELNRSKYLGLTGYCIYFLLTSLIYSQIFNFLKFPDETGTLFLNEFTTEENERFGMNLTNRTGVAIVLPGTAMSLPCRGTGFCV